MNPQLVCATAGLCNSDRVDKLLKEYRLEHPKSECEVCRSETQKLVTKIREADEDTVLDKLLDICGQFSSYSDACRTTVINHFETIYKLLTHNVNDEVCDLVGICAENSMVTFVAQSDDIQCEFCEKVVQHWKDTWTSNTTEEEFKQVLDALCHKLKDNRVEHCLHIVDDYYIPWFNYVLHELDPKVVCTTFGLCNDGMDFLEISEDKSIFIFLPPEVDPELDSVPMTPLLPSMNFKGVQNTELIGGYFNPEFMNNDPVGLPDCDLCKYAVATIETRIGNDRSTNRIQNEIGLICSLVPSSLKSQCKSIVMDYGKKIALALKEGKGAEDICYLIRLCSSPPPAETCGLCQHVLHFIQTRIGNVRSLEKIEHEVEGVCDLIHSDMETECKTTIRAYGDKIINFFIQGFDADEICFKIGLCSSLTGSEVLELNRNDNKCIFCEYAMTTLEHMITDPKNEDEVKSALDKLCQKLPESYQSQCENLVSSYTDQIIHLIINDYPVDVICQMIHLCPPSPLNEQSVADEACDICVNVIQTLDSILTDRNNQEEIKNALESVCEFFPGDMKDKCTEFVDKYSQIIIELLTHDASPKELCSLMNLCPQKKQLVAEENTSARPYCTLCEYAIGEVDKLLTDRRNEDEVKQVLDRICYQLRAPIGKECLRMVNQYTDEIIHMFVNDYTPEQVCLELKLCTSNNDNHYNNNYDEDHPNAIPKLYDINQRNTDLVSDSKPLCAVCQYAMKYLELKVINNRTIDITKRAIQMACSYIPSDEVAEKCEEFVDEYGDEIIQLLEQYEPKEICQSINVCSSSKRKLLGGTRCTWGPSYWCQSPQHAESCGATRHCQERVWNN